MENIKKKTPWLLWGRRGVKSAYPEIANKLAQKRIDDALETDADILVTSCSFCLVNLQEASGNPKPKIKVMDLSEILLWALTRGK